mgnify:CR=1 FL=1
MRPFKSLLLFAVSIILFVYVCGIGVKNVFRYNKLRLDYARNLTALENEKQLNRKYKNQLTRMKSPRYWELAAKRDLGYVRKGEQVYKLAF